MRAEPTKGTRWSAWWAALGIVALALALRLYRIEAQSLWADEGVSVALATRDLATITRDASHDIHPPLYYYLLHFWVYLFGNSELSVRGLSAALGVAVVALTYLAGRKFFSREAGLMAAFLSALSPLQLYYSQETRMYILATFLALGSVLLFWLWLEGERHAWLWLLGYGIATVLSLYTHYFTATLLLAENLAFAIWWWHPKKSDDFLGTPWWRGRPKRSLAQVASWVFVQLAILGLYSPWLWLARGQLRAWPAVAKPLTLVGLLRNATLHFTLGLSTGGELVGFLVPFLAAVVIVGLVPFGEGRGLRLKPPTLVALYLLVPLGCTYLFSLRRPVYNPKFLLFVTPAFHLLLARSAALPLGHGRGRLWPLPLLWTFLSASLILGPGLWSLAGYYFNPRYARDDYRAIARTIVSSERKDDAILVNAPGQMDVFGYYYQGASPIYPLPRGRPLDPEATRAELKEMVEGRERIFAVLWATNESDPQRLIEDWLDEHTFKASDKWYGNVRLAVYALHPSLEDIQHKLGAKLDDSILLLGYSLGREEVAAGEMLPLTLFWQALSPLPERYKVFIHLVDDHQHLVGQRDAEPGGGAKLTTIWKPGEVIADNYGLQVLAGTPPGLYRLEVGMYSLASGERLPIVQEGEPARDRVLLQTISVTRPAIPPSPSTIPMGHRQELLSGLVKLLGYDLFKLGYGHEPSAPLHPGDVLHLTLYWQAQVRPKEELLWTIKLLGKDGQPALTRRTGPDDGAYPTILWDKGEVVRDQHYLFLPKELPPGRYRLTLEVEELMANRRLAQMELAEISIR